jgi:hypothetical protein
MKANMRPFLSAVAGAFALGALAGCSTQPQAVAVKEPSSVAVSANQSVPPPQQENPGPAPAAGAVWTPGYYEKLGTNLVWVPGHWEKPITWGGSLDWWDTPIFK